MPSRELEVVDEIELQSSLERDSSGRVAPTTITSIESEIRVKRANTVNALYDAKPPEVVRAEAELLPLEAWSRIVARMDKEQNVKIDHSITAMGILGLFPVAVREGE